MNHEIRGGKKQGERTIVAQLGSLPFTIRFRADNRKVADELNYSNAWRRYGRISIE